MAPNGAAAAATDAEDDGCAKCAAEADADLASVDGGAGMVPRGEAVRDDAADDSAEDDVWW